MDRLKLLGKHVRLHSVAVLRGKASWQSGTKKCHKVILHNKSHTEIPWERHKRLAASAGERCSREPSWRQTYIGLLGEGVFEG